MINTEEFVIRLQKVIDHYGESASSFAEEIGVQRSSISHILSGRNKPSLDFVLKVLSSFPEVELYWLLNGKGYFPAEEKQKMKPTASEAKTTHQDKPVDKAPTVINFDTHDKAIERIVIFYKDGSFKNFKNP